jgi:hypothetical protein
MGSYETWFVASESVLDALFLGWAATPDEASEPVTPLPIWSSAATPAPPVRPPGDDYLAMLEHETPPGLRALPHFRYKGSPFDLIDQVSAELGHPDPIRPLRYGPHDSGEEVAVVRAFPADVVTALSALDDAAARAVALEVEGGFDDDEPELLALMLALRDLAVIARDTSARLCLFVTL